MEQEPSLLSHEPIGHLSAQLVSGYLGILLGLWVLALPSVATPAFISHFVLFTPFHTHIVSPCLHCSHCSLHTSVFSVFWQSATLGRLTLMELLV